MFNRCCIGHGKRKKRLASIPNAEVQGCRTNNLWLHGSVGDVSKKGDAVVLLCDMTVNTNYLHITAVCWLVV